MPVMPLPSGTGAGVWFVGGAITDSAGEGVLALVPVEVELAEVPEVVLLAVALLPEEEPAVELPGTVSGTVAPATEASFASVACVELAPAELFEITFTVTVVPFETVVVVFVEVV